MTIRTTWALLVTAAVAAALASQARAELVPVADFSDLVLWAGEGENEAGFVLQFSASQTPTAVAWGYRWNGSATMAAMTDAIAGSTTLINGATVPPGLDPRLSIAGTQYPFGVFLSTIAYEQTGLPAGWSQTTRLITNADYEIDGTFLTLYTQPDAAGAWVTEPESTTMLFTYSQVGASDITLTPGGWYGFVQSTGTETFGFSQPVAAVPEPAAWPLVAAAALAAAGWRRCRGRRSLTRGGSPATRVPRA